MTQNPTSLQKLKQVLLKDMSWWLCQWAYDFTLGTFLY